MSGNRKADYKSTIMLSFSGLLSGLVTICGAFMAGQFGFQLFPGVVFGVILSGYFIVSGALRNPRRIIILIAASAAADLVAILVGTVVELALPWESWSMSHPMTASPVALFAGGLFGAVVVVSSAVTQLHPEIKLRDLHWKVFSWSALGGVLGIIGWELGPTLGMALWSAAHALGLTAPTETAQNALGETSRQYSLWLVWQTGMAFVLGIVLQRYEVKPRSKELELP